MDSEKSHSQIERALQDHKWALNALQILVNDGCSRNQLLVALELAFLADDSWKALVDMDLRAFKRVIGQIRDCAAAIERLNRSELIHDLSVEWRSPWFVGLHVSPTLPERLREYASTFATLPQVFGPKQRFRLDTWKAWIVALVLESTKKPHDSEVSALISAVLNDPTDPYSEKAHQAWRLKHTDRIEMMRDILQSRENSLE